ncbi:alpha/beta hydrolase family protein [Leptospira inadai serovar Lyme str. 10]|uniref:Alpha/beta hydrolase family protein n=2 Tax=Leptospira inadai serovar Lyme TaxID=293084 RepID=V6HSE7_9LEPT|nr:alpha/beta fold hydrolase [Leptospira inadai]EQA35524.1 alpha/beta hydrolase family protein [Leptospira inadai serovar Lyme str. 10]PNV76093.1 alpha/beta hydrolase [Leptospira inadai serovar Lyme]
MGMIRKALLSFVLLSLFASCSANIALNGEISHPKTADNWNLSIEHFPPIAGTALKKFPAIICHGFIANRKYFKINEKSSLVASLQKEGYDVWLLDLRGRQDAGSPSLFFGEKTFDYSIDDYIKQDVDAAIKHVLNATGKEKVNWIGHSMGGMLLYARLGTLGENRVANLITIGSPIIMDPPSRALQLWTNFTWGLYLWPVVPTETWSGIRGGTGIPFLPKKNFEELFWHEKNIDPKIVSGVFTTSIASVTKREARQMEKVIETGSFRTEDGQQNYADGIANIKIPTLIIGGRRDKLGFTYSLRYVYDNIGTADKTLFIASKGKGHSDDYGHTDLLVGKKADEDVFPVLVRWLNKRN